jgi:hypothetical protein
VKIIKLIILCLFLNACATQPKVVNLPTPVKCPAPVIHPEPDYLIHQLTPADKHDYPKGMGRQLAAVQNCAKELYDVSGGI